MKTKMKTNMVFISILILLILISGCTGFPDIFGKDVVNVQTVVTKDKTTDAMVVKEIMTIPRSPLLPNQAIVLSFIIENKDDLKPLNNVYVDLYNAPLFKNIQGTLCNLYQSVPPCPPSECGQQKCRILAGEEKLITFNLLSPTEDEIVNIRTQEKLDFRVNYDFDGSLLYTVPVVNMDEIINRQRQGQKTTVQISKAHGSGPIQIDVELFGAPYILSDYSATFMFKIRNKGSGVLKGKNEIEIGKLVIEFPAELVNGRLIDPGDYTYNFGAYYSPTGYATTPPEQLGTTPLPPARDLSDIYEEMKPSTAQPIFDCKDLVNVIRCTNLKPLALYKDETRTSMRFEMPKVIDLKYQGQNQPFKSYEIRAYVSYTYELRNSVDVVINPYGNV